MTRSEGDTFQIEISLSRPVPVDRLRHAVAHELAHVLIDAWVQDPALSKGLAGEYAAERIAWQLLDSAGFRAGTDVFVSPERENQAAWVPVLARIVDQLHGSPWRPGDEGSDYRQAERRLFRAGWQLGRSEAYRRGQADAGVKVPAEPEIPDILRCELDRVFGSLATSPFPADIGSDSLREFLSYNAPRTMANLREFTLRELARVGDAVLEAERDSRTTA